MSSIIKVENLGKSYSISHEERERYTALRDVIARKAKKIFSFNKSTNKQIHGSTKEEFWALKDINFEVQQGDRIGIIGRNGAGKSTLLKILSRITEPTTGSVKIKGRVASLLEVGTGFHPELTGAENIYLNGAILGMSRAEVKKKFDEIVDFAEVQKFLDTPVKRYSSGMYVRLAFAVAAHLEPEILVVDEVLAVGDAEFQKKCIGKMEDVSKNEGRTVLFVSHNMPSIMQLCKKVILLESGLVKEFGDATNVIKSYLEASNIDNDGLHPNRRKPGDNIVKLISVSVVTSDLKKKYSFDTSERIGIQMIYEVLKPGYVLWLGHNIYNSEGINVFDTHSVTLETYSKPHDIGVFKSIAWIPENLLNEDTYFVSSAIFNHNKHIVHFHERNIVSFSTQVNNNKLNAKGMSVGKFPGVVMPLLKWELEKMENQ